MKLRTIFKKWICKIEKSNKLSFIQQGLLYKKIIGQN